MRRALGFQLGLRGSGGALFELEKTQGFGLEDTDLEMKWKRGSPDRRADARAGHPVERMVVFLQAWPVTWDPAVHMQSAAGPLLFRKLLLSVCWVLGIPWERRQFPALKKLTFQSCGLRWSINTGRT